jgi:hypothetical protein
MLSTQSWQARHDELSASLRRIGQFLGNQSTPELERKQIGDEFIRTWQEFTQHLKQHPDLIRTAGPRT